MEYTSPPGVFDIIPFDEKEPWKSSSIWQKVENLIRELAEAYNFHEIRTPHFEKTELFTRSVGEETDIVSKEMYTFIDKGERSLTLRPEGTASFVRAFIEGRFNTTLPCQKFYYVGSMFRYERPQGGRFREFHQFGVEAIGSNSPEQDAEIIDFAYSLFKELGLKGLTVYINSIGNKASRDAYKEKFIDYLKDHADSLSSDSQNRLIKNPLRILDSKDEKDREILKNAPSILDFLNEEDASHFKKLEDFLKLLEIPYKIDPLLVRGLDYYNKTVFEIISADLGAQSTVCGGGRYDGLLKTLGGPDLPSIGFAVGLERLIQILIKQDLVSQKFKGPKLYLIPYSEKEKQQAFFLAKELRQAGISVEVDFDSKKVGKAFSKASSMNALYAAVLGEKEILENALELKNLATQEKSQVKLDSLKHFFK